MSRTILVLFLAGCTVEVAPFELSTHDDGVPTSSAELGLLPCATSMVDFWRVPGTALHDGSIRAVVDTVDPATTFDPRLWVVAVNTWGEGPEDAWFAFDTAMGDDEFACSAPPESGQCPQALFTLGADSDDDVAVVVMADNGACAGATGEYTLEVTVDGQPITPSYEGQADFYDTSLW